MPACRETVFSAALTKFIFVFQYSEQTQKEPTYTVNELINGRGEGGAVSNIRNNIFIAKWMGLYPGELKTGGPLTWNFTVYFCLFEGEGLLQQVFPVTTGPILLNFIGEESRSIRRKTRIDNSQPMWLPTATTPT